MSDHTPNENEIPYGYCHCGCGKKTNLARYNDPDRGWVNGEPFRFIRGHNMRRDPNREGPNPSGICRCGCGQETEVAKKSDSRYGWVKDRHKPYVNAIHAKRHNIGERFWEKVDKRGPDECWEWTANRDRKGYGKFSVHGKQDRAHRFSYELHHDSIPEGMHVCHACDNPSCVNPDHLWLGEPQDNISDMLDKGRDNHVANEAHHQARFTNEQARELRRQHFEHGVGTVELARQNGVHRSTMRRLLKGITYQDA